MGRRGPQPTDTKTLKARGSWRGIRREKDEYAASHPSRERKSKEWKPLSEVALRKLIREIPGYDPYRDAGDCKFLPRLANKALAFFPEQLNHIEGALTGEPFILERWQQAILANLYGWVKWSDKWKRWVRRYRECFIY